jgi:hypothetical protein
MNGIVEHLLHVFRRLGLPQRQEKVPVCHGGFFRRVGGESVCEFPPTLPIYGVII